MANILTVNPNIPVIALLVADPSVSAMVGNQVYSPRIPAKPTFDVDNGPGISLRVRGGTLSLYDPIVEPSFQVTCWGIDSKTAQATMAAVMNVLHDLPDQCVQTVDGIVRVLSGVCEVYPQDVADSDTGWDTCVGFFRLKMVLTNAATGTVVNAPMTPEDVGSVQVGSPISALMAVCITNGTAQPATTANGVPAVGIATTGSASGTINVQYSGVLTSSTWNWQPNRPVFVGPNAMLTQDAPDTGFIQEVGYPISATSILIEVQEATVIQ